LGLTPPADPLATTDSGEAPALFRIFLALLLGLVGTIVTIVVAFLLFESVAAGPSGLPSIVGFAVASAILGGLLEIAQIVLIATGFRTLSKFNEAFSTPSKMAWFGIVAVLLFDVAVAEALSASGSGSPTTDLGYFLALFVFAGIFAIIGAVGVLVGFWRMGSEYEVGRMKAGVVLSFFPFLDIIGYGLLLSGSFRIWRMAVRRQTAGPL